MSATFSDLGEALELLTDAIENDDVLAAAAVHTTFVHRFDAHVTMLQKADGDSADIVQTVAWQSVLYVRLKEAKNLDAADEVIDSSAKFIAAYQERKNR